MEADFSFGGFRFEIRGGIDLTVERVRFALEIKICGKMDHRSDAGAIGRPHAGRYGFFRGQVDTDTLCSWRRPAVAGASPPDRGRQERTGLRAC